MTTCAFHSIKLKKVKKGEIVVVLLFQGIKGHITRIKVYLVNFNMNRASPTFWRPCGIIKNDFSKPNKIIKNRF
jgi:hypothetical protein